MKSKKFKLPNMDFPEVDNSLEIIVIKDSLTYDKVKPILTEIFEANKVLEIIRCEKIREIDVTGIQFLLSAKKQYPKLKIETDFTDEVKELIEKNGYKF